MGIGMGMEIGMGLRIQAKEACGGTVQRNPWGKAASDPLISCDLGCTVLQLGRRGEGSMQQLSTVMVARCGAAAVVVAVALAVAVSCCGVVAITVAIVGCHGCHGGCHSGRVELFG